jgi:hypothetical protein
MGGTANTNKSFVKSGRKSSSPKKADFSDRKENEKLDIWVQHILYRNKAESEG